MQERSIYIMLSAARSLDSPMDFLVTVFFSSWVISISATKKTSIISVLCESIWHHYVEWPPWRLELPDESSVCSTLSYITANEVEWGILVSLFPPVCLSVRPSVRPSVCRPNRVRPVSSTILAFDIVIINQPTSRSVSRVKILKIFQKLKFCHLFSFMT